LKNNIHKLIDKKCLNQWGYLFETLYQMGLALGMDYVFDLVDNIRRSYVLSAHEVSALQPTSL